ncbi:MAG: HIT family protein [Phycisphaerales bacterium]
MNSSPAVPGPITSRLARIIRGDDPQSLGRMASGWAILSNQQPEAITGCCMLIPDPVVSSVNDLSETERGRFMGDLVRLGDAVLEATGAERINYLILCNQVPELHGHVIPRFAAEDPARRRLGPFEAYDFPGARLADAGPAGPDGPLLARLKQALGAGPSSST